MGQNGAVISRCRPKLVGWALAAWLTVVTGPADLFSQELPPAIIPTSEGDFPSEQLAAVADFTGLARVEERDIYYGLLEVARLVPLKVQKQRARDVVTAAEEAFRADPRRKGQRYSLFADLVLAPQRYRGRPITFEGYIQKLDRMEAGDNPFGMQELYQAYLFTEESKGNPLVIVCRNVPRDMPQPTKGNATNYVHVTGYFYKLWPYEAAVGNWAAPLLMADRLEYRPPRPSRSSELIRQACLIGVPTLFTLVAVTVWYRNRAFNRLRRQQAAQALAPLDFPDVVANDGE
jgi:hypothetical protein